MDPRRSGRPTVDRKAADEFGPFSFRLARDAQERAKCFRLVYRSYRDSGLIAENEHGMRVTPYHLFPGSSIFAATDGQRVGCTLSLLVDGPAGIPMESIFGDEVQQLRDQGMRFGEISSLAADADLPRRRFRQSFAELTRALAQHADFHGLQHLLIAVHPRHARLYQRKYGVEPFSETRQYGVVQDAPAVACRLDFKVWRQSGLASWDKCSVRRYPLVNCCDVQ